MYASDFDSSSITYFNESIRCTDDANILKLSKKDSSIQTYRDTSLVEQLHSAWKETYNGDFYGDIVFDNDAQAYNIGMKLLKKKNLTDFSSDNALIYVPEQLDVKEFKLKFNEAQLKKNKIKEKIKLFELNKEDLITKYFR